MPKAARRRPGGRWSAYYRRTSKRPPRETLVQVLGRIDSEQGSGPGRTAIELGFGAGTDTLELLRKGWTVLAIDREAEAARVLARRVPAAWRDRLTVVVAPMEEVRLPTADLVYAGFSLPFCPPDRFPVVWRNIRKAVRPGGHFAGQLFGDRDEWNRERSLTFHRRREVERLAYRWRVELLRETDEDGQTMEGPKRWHFFDLILEQRRHPGRTRSR